MKFIEENIVSMGLATNDEPGFIHVCLIVQEK